VRIVNSGSKWMVQALGPMTVILLLGGFLWFSNRGKAPALKLPPPPTRSLADFSALKPGGTVPDWSTSQGNFRLVSREGRTVMELSHEPMVEGRLVWNRIFKSHGMIRSRMWGEKARRASPRFALGVAGSSSAYWLRAIPAEKSIQIVSQEETIASVPWEWDSVKPVWLELRVVPAADGKGSSFEGRVWHEGEAQPETPTLVLSPVEDLGFARASAAAAPYALKPVYIDHLEVSSP